MSIGSNIRGRRRAKDLTQDQFAEKLGVSRAYVVQMEKNIKIPNMAVAKAAADVLGCTLDELAADRDDPQD